MDMESGRQQLITYVKKYQYVFIIVLIGVCFMLIPEQNKEPKEVIQSPEMILPELETELSSILSNIHGVGKAEVLLTEDIGRDIIYQVDTAQNGNNMSTVIVMDETRTESGLVKQTLPPVYRGAVIVCEGADSANVRLSVVAAVKSVTGLSADCITVLKMK